MARCVGPPQLEPFPSHPSLLTPLLPCPRSLAGFTQRITTLTAVLDDLQSGFYVRTMVAGAAAAGAPEAAALAIEDGPPAAAAAATGALALSSPSPPPAAAPERRPLMSPAAVLVEVEGGDVISFAGVPLRTPNGDVLLRSLDLEVRAGMNTLIAGPNGCGKSSFFRVLRGLWPQFGGRIERPPLSQLLYIPQRPYLTLGSLRDQVTYPLSAAEAAAAGRSEADVAAVLQAAHLQVRRRGAGWTGAPPPTPTPALPQPILARVGGLDAILDWADVLSGGEKQRVGFARLLFHRRAAASARPSPPPPPPAAASRAGPGLRSSTSAALRSLSTSRARSTSGAASSGSRSSRSATGAASGATTSSCCASTARAATSSGG